MHHDVCVCFDCQCLSIGASKWCSEISSLFLIRCVRPAKRSSLACTKRCAVHAEPNKQPPYPWVGLPGGTKKAAVVHAQMFPFVLTCGEQLLSIIVVSFHYVIVVASQQQHKHQWVASHSNQTQLSFDTVLRQCWRLHNCCFDSVLRQCWRLSV